MRIALLALAVTVALTACVATGRAGMLPIAPANHGVRLGLNFSNMFGEAFERDGGSPFIGLSAGYFQTFRIIREIHFQPELLVSFKGTNREYEVPYIGGLITIEESPRIYYIELPLLVKLPFPWQDYSRSSLYLGPVPALNLGGHNSGSWRAIGEGRLTDGSFDGSIGNDKTFDIGLALGFDTYFKFGSRQAVIDVRYTFGMSRAFENVDDLHSIPDNEYPLIDRTTLEGEELKNGAISISLGLLL